MSISSNSVIHFTSQFDYLKGILKEGFEVKFCVEETYVKSGKFGAAIPMVSFCDNPLSEIKNHIFKYGSYGIGLKKEWAAKNGLNPVLYIERSSLLGDNLRDAVIEYTKQSTGQNQNETQKKLLDVGRYIKNYQRDLIRNGETYKNYRFYDEREWRFVPDISHEPIAVGLNVYGVPQRKKELNDLFRKIKLSFKATTLLI